MFLVCKSGAPQWYFKLFVAKNSALSFFYVSYNTKLITEDPVDPLQLIFSS